MNMEIDVSGALKGNANNENENGEVYTQVNITGKFQNTLAKLSQQMQASAAMLDGIIPIDQNKLNQKHDALARELQIAQDSLQEVKQDDNSRELRNALQLAAPAASELFPTSSSVHQKVSFQDAIIAKKKDSGSSRANKEKLKQWLLERINFNDLVH